MGHSYRRVGVNGKIRYAAIFHDVRGERRSAGTYSTKREADRAWASAESDALLGEGRDPRRGKITFTNYVTGTWLTHHQLEQTTRQRYELSRSRVISRANAAGSGSSVGGPPALDTASAPT